MYRRNRLGVDVEPVGDLTPRDQRPRLQELEELEEPCGRGLHGRKSSTDRGQVPPYLRRRVVRTRSRRPCGDGAGHAARGDGERLRLLVRHVGRPQPMADERLAGSDDWEEFPARSWRGRCSTGSGTRTSSVPTTPAGSSGCPSASSTREALVDLLGGQPPAGRARPPVFVDLLGRRRPSRARTSTGAGRFSSASRGRASRRRGRGGSRRSRRRRRPGRRTG